MVLKVYQYFELLSLLIAIYCYKGLTAYALRAFIPLLLLVNIIEIIGINYKAFGWGNNYFIYNLNLLLVTPVYLYLVGSMLRLRDSEKHIFTAIAFLCMAIIILNYCFLQGCFQFNTFSLILIEIITIVFSCFVLLRVFVQQEEPVRLFREPCFWINAANLLFALVTLVLLGLQQYILSNHIELGKKSLYYAILPGVNVFLYSTYSYAFILCRIQTVR